jgi:chemotaxis protein methyltransferase CheR
MEEEFYFQKVMQLVFRHMGLDCRHYKLAYLKRRMGIRMRATRRLTFEEYAQLLEQDPEEFAILLDRLTINVSHFFRDYNVFKQLSNLVVPRLRQKPPISIWSAGCANGEEPYTLSIMMQEAMPSYLPWEILATDVDPACLERAGRGVYKSQSLAEVPLNLKNRYFSGGEDQWHISPEIKKRVKFQLGDLTGSLPKGPFDLIICRNVLIYFVSELQERLYRNYYNILKPDGFLVLGKTETLLGDVRNLYQVVDLRERIFQKRPAEGA